MLIARKAFYIPANTGFVVIAPGYEKPLLQLCYNTTADRSQHVRELPALPPGLPPSAAVADLNAEAEAQRLCARYKPEQFRKIYPVDELFQSAFEACATTALPSAAPVVPEAPEVENMLVDELLELNVPTLDKAKAEVLVAAGLTSEALLSADAKGVAAKTNLPLNLIRSTVEAVKARNALAPRGAPSAPSEFRATVSKGPGHS